MAAALEGLTAALSPNPDWDHGPMLSAAEAMQASIERMAQDSSAPAKQGYIIHQLRDFMGEDDILSLDNGIHMMWGTRNYAAYQPNTMLIDHALGSMGISLPAAIAAKLVFPERKVAVLTGDGGFMMNSQDLETAVRLDLDIIIVIFNDSGFGMIRAKQMADGHGHYAVEFKNPDFVAYANSFGAHGHRVDDPGQFRAMLDEAASQGGIHVIDVPVSAKQDMALLKEMKSVDCNQFDRD
jgi:acetolactate synthase-1/2/3 large subunit